MPAIRLILALLAAASLSGLAACQDKHEPTKPTVGATAL